MLVRTTNGYFINSELVGEFYPLADGNYGCKLVPNSYELHYMINSEIDQREFHEVTEDELNRVYDYQFNRTKK